MALRRTSDELFDFKRIFILMLGLVVLPTLLLSGFGILAIKNERAALEKRQLDTYEARSGRIEAELLSRFKVEPIPPEAGDSEARLQAANRTLMAVVHDLYPDEKARFALVSTNGLESTSRSLTELLRALSPNWPAGSSLDAASAPRPIVRRPLPVPYQDLQLGAYLTDVDPVGDAMVRNTIIYSSLMVLFLALVIIGVVVTARFIHREVKLSRLQTDFVSNVSHELRTPLTSIRMFIETLQMGRVEDEAEVRECLGIIAVESERLTRMIERILGWARMEAGRRVYSFQEVEVAHLIDQAREAFRTQQIRSAFTLDESIEPDLPPIRADVGAMSEALLNLLNNALKYTGDRKIIGIRAYMHRGQVAIEVSDNGVGISPKDRKRIFEKFYRADSLLSRKTEGSGLGLSIVRHIVEAHGGRIQVESELGVGSRFTLLMPPASSSPRRLKA